MSGGPKSSVDEIRQRFDNDVERFSNLETGQSATMDAPLVLELVTQAAAVVSPQAKSLLDIGCGAGNYSLKMIERVSGLDVTLVDLSRPMLARANERVSAATTGRVALLQGDIRERPLGPASYDIVLAAATLHHLRSDAEWESLFAKVFTSLRPGGSFWIADLVWQEDERIRALMWQRYGDYLTVLGGAEYRDKVLAYVKREDTPRPATYQLDLLRRVGFASVDIMHKNACFAAFGGVKR